MNFNIRNFQLSDIPYLYDICLKLSEYTIALRVAIKLDDHDRVK